MNGRGMIRALAAQFDAEDNAAHDLWTWLPSYKIAEKHHGDYAFEFRPSIASLLIEATVVIAEKAGSSPSDIERAEWNECPCGAGHDEVTP